jgi:tRNA A-37 threonylcarbamoyl transferase component Bud32
VTVGSADQQLSSVDDRLADLVLAAEERRDQGQDINPAELCRDCPELLQPLQQALEAIGLVARVLPAATQKDTPPKDTPAGPGPLSLCPFPQIPGYEILGELGAGGMGRVYKARQVHAQRVVALKMIRAGQWASTVDVQRFRAEAKQVANLDHPHIVPIYDVDEHQGQPYFSMKLIEGGSLAQQVGRGREDPRWAAQLVATAAQAVSYAHQRRLLHRDLKPANILLDVRGQPHVTDFGLARPVDAEAAQTTGLPRSHPILDGVPSAAQTRPDLTAAGTILGTPSYMAPEQARGEQVLSTAVDVYGLGAILYELLTGRPPFPLGKVDSTLAILLQVRSGTEPVPPSRLHPGVNPDLEAICLKCLRHDPAQRYSSTEALASDLGRFLAGEPVVARPVGVLRRLVMWVRRRPVQAGMLAALVLATVVSVGSAVWAVQERNRARDALAQKTIALRDLTELATGMWRVIRTDEALLARAPETEQLRKQILQNTLRIYRRLLEENSNDRGIRTMTARLCSLVSNILQNLGETTQAKEVSAQEILLYEKLNQEYPNHPSYRQNLARAYDRRGLFFYKGDPKEVQQAGADFRAAQDLSQKLMKDFPDEPSHRNDLATWYFHQGVLLNNEGERLIRAFPADREKMQQANHYLDRAEQAYTRARDIIRAGARDLDREPAEHRYTLAKAYTWLGSLLRNRNRPREAEANYSKAQRLYQDLLGEEPRVAEYREQLAQCHYQRAALLGKEGVTPCHDAVTQQTKLVDDYPTVPRYRADLARTHLLLGTLLATTGRPKEAADCYNQVIGLNAKLVKEFPREPEYRIGLARGLYHQARLLALQPPPQAWTRICDLLQQAIVEGKRARELNPGEPTYRQVLFESHRELAQILLLLQNHTGAAAQAAQLHTLGLQNGREYNLLAQLLVRCVSIARKDPALTEAQRQQLTQEYGKRAVAVLDRMLDRHFTTPSKLAKHRSFLPLHDRADFQATLKKPRAKP